MEMKEKSELSSIKKLAALWNDNGFSSRGFVVEFSTVN